MSTELFGKMAQSIIDGDSDASVELAKHPHYITRKLELPSSQPLKSREATGLHRRLPQSDGTRLRG